MRVRIRSLGFVVLALLLAGTAGAGMKRCGDDVDGRPVACDCGDVLVSSRRLGADDPITTRVCEWNGLVIDVPAGASPVVLDLGGATLTGSRRGYGIHVTAGGDGGVTITGPGEVRGFRIGVVSDGRALRRISEVIASGNVRDGFRVAGQDFTLVGCTASRNGTDGFALHGRKFSADGNRAHHNGRLGFRVAGRNGTVGGVRGNEASLNRRGGFAMRGRNLHRVQPDARACGEDCR
jgi:hypothetical protein